MKKCIGWPIAWILFISGDLISRLMNLFPSWGLYWIYNNLMYWSISVQDWADIKGLWNKIE